MKYEGKVAMVTGAASGMGQNIARRLARGGAKVAILDLNEEALQATASEFESMTAFACDVADAESVKSAVTRAQEQLGSLDILVHCAAIMPTIPVMESPEGQINKTMAINYGGTVNMVEAVLPGMRERGRGTLVMFGSIAGSVLVTDLAAYCASKAATNAFGEVLIRENRGSGVHIMLVCPPMVNTPLLQQAREGSDPKSIRESMEKGRLAEPDFIIDKVEEGMAKGTEILLPGMEAKVLVWMRRMMPRLLWKIIDLSNKE